MDKYFLNKGGSNMDMGQFMIYIQNVYERYLKELG